MITTIQAIKALEKGQAYFAEWRSKSADRQRVVYGMIEDGSILIEGGEFLSNRTLTAWNRSIHIRAHLVDSDDASLCGARSMDWTPGKLGLLECQACKKIAINKSQS